tara:strand:- start:1315 stop:1872 length:558 start_codon:yes stop_codon:yes gene_type:complete
LEWATYAVDSEWWEYIYEGFMEDVRPFGVSIGPNDVHFSVGYCQSDYAAFTGRIDIATYMQAKSWDEIYPALYLAVRDCGDYATVSEMRSYGRVCYDGACIGNTYPAGVFQHLDQETWDELVEEQYSSSGIEDELQSYVDEVCKDLYQRLRDEYEHQTSEEAFIESCECNEITFEIEGENHEIFA